MNAKKLIILAGLLIGCANEDTTTNTTPRLACTTTPDCAARGGTCMGNECHATNECTVDADCQAGTTCVSDPDFGGLCTAAGQPPAPLPAWSCTSGKDCPAGQGCASDGKCHVDGECQNAWQGDELVGNCANGLMCAAGGDPLAGFCTSGRGGPDPYCRSTGTGECRTVCSTNDDCGGFGSTCSTGSQGVSAGFCVRGDECQVQADCSPNHICGNPPNWDDYGYKFCLVDPNPTCVNDGLGACRLACATNRDCLNGGGCGTDGLCHASNECQTVADCDPGLVCYASAEWGGLCGAPRP